MSARPTGYIDVVTDLLVFCFHRVAQMLDRFEQHTLKCSSCRRAYTAFQALQKFLIGATVLFCATVGIPSDMKLRIFLAGLALVSAGLAFASHELQKNFVFVDYVHAEID